MNSINQIPEIAALLKKSNHIEVLFDFNYHQGHIVFKLYFLLKIFQ